MQARLRIEPRKMQSQSPGRTMSKGPCRLLAIAQKEWPLRAAATISQVEVTKLLEKKAAVTPIQANRLKAVLSTAFKFAAANGLVPASPVVGVAKPARDNQRDR